MYYLIVARYTSVEWGIQYHIYALPFAALGVGLGTDWLLQWRPRVVMRMLGAAS